MNAITEEENLAKKALKTRNSLLVKRSNVV